MNFIFVILLYSFKLYVGSLYLASEVNGIVHQSFRMRNKFFFKEAWIIVVKNWSVLIIKFDLGNGFDYKNDIYYYYFEVSQ